MDFWVFDVESYKVHKYAGSCGVVVCIVINVEWEYRK